MERQHRRRRRPAHSCVECRRRKIKCDRNAPCNHCVLTDTECVFKLFHDRAEIPSEVSVAQGTAARGTPAPSPLLTVQDQPVSTTPVDESPQNPDTASKGTRNRSTQRQSQGGDIFPSFQREPSPSSPHGNLAETGRGILESQFGLEPSQILLNKTRTLRSSNWMSTAPEVRTYQVPTYDTERFELMLIIPPV